MKWDHRPADGVWARLLYLPLLAIALVLVGSGPGGQAAPIVRPTASRLSAAARPAYLQYLFMTSATSGWALHWTGNPFGPGSPVLMPAHTTDGGRTWTDVASPAARRMLTAPVSQVALRPTGGRRAWLAVTAAESQEAYCITPHRTRTFGTADAGQSWHGSAVIPAAGFARFIDFVSQADGWLVQDLGAAGLVEGGPQNWLQVYRTTDGGAHWSRIAATFSCSKTGISRSGLPTFCDKSGIAFATAQVGWVTAGCHRLAYAVLVTRDGGVHWAAQRLPLAARLCQVYGCAVTPPQFFGRTGYLTIGRYPRAVLLVSHDLGRTWTRLRLPAGAGIYPQVRFFGPRNGFIVAAGAQGSFGRVFYSTSDGGRTWTPIRQGMTFSRFGFLVEFISQRTGFAWVQASDAAKPQPAYQTTNGGRTWKPFAAHLAG